MYGHTHLIAGALLGVALATGAQVSPVETLLYVGAGALGALLPDVDTPGSLLRWRMPLLNALFGLVVPETSRHYAFTVCVGFSECVGNWKRNTLVSAVGAGFCESFTAGHAHVFRRGFVAANDWQVFVFAAASVASAFWRSCR